MHGEVEQDDIRADLPDAREAAFEVRRVIEVERALAARLQHHPDQAAIHRVVVDQQNACEHGIRKPPGS